MSCYIFCYITETFHKIFPEIMYLIFLWNISCCVGISCSSGVLLHCPYSCSLSTAITSMGIISAITHTALSETVRKAQDTLRALSRLTAAIFRRHFLILRASPQMAISYVSVEIATDTRSFLRGYRGLPMFGMSLANAVATLVALTAACSTWGLKLTRRVSTLRNLNFNSDYARAQYI